MKKQLLVAVVCLLVSCGSRQRTYEVTFEVTGNAALYDVSYYIGPFDEEEEVNEYDVPSGWTYEFIANKDDWVRITGTAKDSSSASTVKVTITANYSRKNVQIYEERNATGSYASATAGAHLYH